jgi:hypothetical protein
MVGGCQRRHFVSVDTIVEEESLHLRHNMRSALHSITRYQIYLIGDGFSIEMLPKL